jgi:hypothetical protein
VTHVIRVELKVDAYFGCDGTGALLWYQVNAAGLWAKQGILA